MIDDYEKSETPSDDDRTAFIRSAEADDRRFLLDEGLELLATYRAIEDPAVRQAVVTLIHALARGLCRD